MGVLHIVNSVMSRAALGTSHAVGLAYLPTCFNGQFIRLPTEVWTSLYSRYEPYNAQIICQHLRKGDFFLDIGAHHGLWSLFAAKLVGRDGLVVSCEPSPAFVKLARAAASYPQIRPIRVGLGSREADLEFFAQGDASSGSFVSDVTEINRAFNPNVPVSKEKVSIKPVDAVVKDSGRQPNFMKIDVEGFELEVIRGASNTLSQKELRGLLIEVHPPQLALSGGTEAELLAMISNHGFSATVVDRNPNSLYTIFAERI